ncbi:MAG: transglutaminase domain-containing protein, partial [Nitrospirae bacterium]|nr:transglutaminase domain-containing protein [Nitrospirota bacterium]
VYKDGYFYFHTWPEVWFDKWIPVDPTLAQFPADVTHIPLKEGTLKDIISILNDLKNIKIEILEAS